MDLVPHIFHEQQEGNLCAQHCLNALLQGPYFTAIDLAELARQLDQKEQDALGQSDFGSSNQKSQNMDDSGFFSVQVLSHALSIWNIQIIPWGAEEVVAARAEPEREAAFICNLDLHWYTLRRFGPSAECWYDLNSMHPRPQRMSAIYLNMTLSQLEAEGYSIFVVRPLVSNEAPLADDDTSEQAEVSEPVEKEDITTPPPPPPPTETSSATPTFMNERQEMERLRRQRIEERERAAAGNTLPSASPSSSSSTAPPGPHKRAHADNDQEVSGRKEAKRSLPESNLVTTPSFLPRCEADTLAATMPLGNTQEAETPGSKNQAFSGSGYRLGESSPPPSDATTDVLSKDFTDFDEADTEWEMMQQAIAMSLQGNPQ